MDKRFIEVLTLFIFILTSFPSYTNATDISDNTFLIAEITDQNYYNERLWNLLKREEAAGIEMNFYAKGRNVLLQQSSISFADVLFKLNELLKEHPSKIIPVFLNYNDDVLLLDSIINESEISSSIFYSPQGETWPSMDYLVQSNRRLIFFIEGDFTNESKILHDLKNYAFQISADKPTNSSIIFGINSNVNLELFVIDNFEKTPTVTPVGQNSKDMIPDYINFLLDNWKLYGKKPNFIFVGKDIFNFDFIINQLNSFTWIKGHVKISGKTLDKVYWKNPDVLVTGGNFSFPYRGGEEIILSPFAPGYKMTPEQVIVTGEMAVPESYSIIATPMELRQGLTASFNFEGILMNNVKPEQTFSGENFSFVQDIDRGEVLRLPENASINLGNPDLYGLRNSSFTVGCFVKFTEILDFGDNAILGNYESGYRRGLHLILRSGHPYFGLWNNDFESDQKLQTNIWYHLTWRYINETGEQAIFLNGRYIGGSDGHPPFSGTGDIHLGSALSSGASLRGYIDNLRIWDRPLGNEEINRLALDEEIPMTKADSLKTTKKSINTNIITYGLILTVLLLSIAIIFFFVRKKNLLKVPDLPVIAKENQIVLFGEFKAINADGRNISDQFTTKVKELFLFCLIATLKNSLGASVSEINEELWAGIPDKKASNNRSVTLNKLRKLLSQFKGIEIVSNAGYVQVKTEAPFFCDYAEAFQLCQIPEGMTRLQLITFFHLVRRGRFLKGITWEWLDDIRGFTGNQVIDNLLKLASIYKKESNLQEIEKVAQRILDYDELNEEAIYLQVWAQQKANNPNLAKFSFNSFAKKYENNMGESYPLSFAQFTRHFETIL
ncbi:MAG: LamG-like jellyroll fold domain-containing protein [Draconibacterium sp.]